tara:strand:+ start:1110 stop:2168 length:1059 start_codon:yes stop_codon:yes gene_type:complete
MGFGGGGGGPLPVHVHNSVPLQGGPLDFVNDTIASLTANSMTYSDGAALQELTIGTDAQVLAVSGGAPAWITNTSNPLVKVTKTFSDIDGGTASMDIYTLPEDSALVNVWADITSVFDISTGVTLGDAGDQDGFAQATDWTSGTGLTDATRGAYVTSFKTMRSTSGTTAIKAYNFSTTTTGTTFSQLATNDNRSIQNSGRQELAQQMNTGQVLVGENIGSVSFWLSDGGGSPTGTIRAFIRQSDGTLIQESSDTLDASTLTGSYVEHSFAFPNTTLSDGDMITISGADMTGSSATCLTQTTEMTNGKLYDTTSTGSNYSQIVANEMTMTVLYDVSVNTDTQGAIDFYLQVVN